MKVVDIIEHEDGSATITLDMSKEEHLSIMEGALLRAIKLGLSTNNPADWNGCTTEKYTCGTPLLDAFTEEKK
jgi:hypothetical protein